MTTALTTADLIAWAVSGLSIGLLLGWWAHMFHSWALRQPAPVPEVETSAQALRRRAKLVEAARAREAPGLILEMYEITGNERLN